MHPELTYKLARERVRELSEHAARTRRSGLRRPGPLASPAATVVASHQDNDEGDPK